MRGARFRFRPPECELTLALRWTLSRAYGPIDPSPTALALDPAERPRALHWSRALALEERIASRQARTRIEDEAGAEVAEQLWLARDALAARSLLLQRLLDRTVGKAEELECPLIALKGIALLESGASKWGGRPLVDLDLLVGPNRTAELESSLRGLGMQPSGADERHHLRPLADPQLGELELHMALPGLALGESATTPQRLHEAGLTEPSARLRGLLLPRPPLLAAHLIAHAVHQHGLSPTAYPVTRLAADLLDLAAARQLSVAELAQAAAPLLGRAVSEREQAAVAALCELLAEGGDPTAGEPDPRALLGHTLAALTRPRYRHSLRRRAALRALGRGDWRKLRPQRRTAAEI